MEIDMSIRIRKSDEGPKVGAKNSLVFHDFGLGTALPMPDEIALWRIDRPSRTLVWIIARN
jgi:hypothetical protein